MNAAGLAKIARHTVLFEGFSTGTQVLDFHVKTAFPHLGVHPELRRVLNGIVEASIAAKLEFPALLVQGDAAQQFPDLVAGEQRSIQHAHFAMQPHPRRMVRFQQQFLCTFLNGKEKQILQVEHASHARYSRARQDELQPGLG